MSELKTTPPPTQRPYYLGVSDRGIMVVYLRDNLKLSVELGLFSKPFFTKFCACFKNISGKFMIFFLIV